MSHCPSFSHFPFQPLWFGVFLMALSLPQAPCKGCGTGSQSRCPSHVLVGHWGSPVVSLCPQARVLLALGPPVLTPVLVPAVAVLVLGHGPYKYPVSAAVLHWPWVLLSLGVGSCPSCPGVPAGCSVLPTPMLGWSWLKSSAGCEQGWNPESSSHPCSSVLAQPSSHCSVSPACPSS